jgi:hypothetical protein
MHQNTLPPPPPPSSNETGGNSKEIGSLIAAFEHTSKSSPAYGTVYRIIITYAATSREGYWKVLKLVSVFIEASQNYFFFFFFFSIIRHQNI